MSDIPVRAERFVIADQEVIIWTIGSVLIATADRRLVEVAVSHGDCDVTRAWPPGWDTKSRDALARRVHRGNQHA